jgi:hypothetical protein
MAEVTYIVPTMWDYFSDIITGVPFWCAVGVAAVLTVAMARAYRKRRGWL